MHKVSSAVEWFEFTSLADVPNGVDAGRLPWQAPALGELPRRLGRDMTDRVAMARAARSSIKPGMVRS